MFNIIFFITFVTMGIVMYKAHETFKEERERAEFERWAESCKNEVENVDHTTTIYYVFDADGFERFKKYLTTEEN